jgi:uncharacterized protein (UPF0128 family)
VLVGGKAKEDKYKKYINALGGKCIEDLSEDFDVYVTDEKLVRNSKLLLAIAKGASVVSVKWLEESNKKKKFVEEEPFHIIDKAFEKQYNCQLAKLYSKQSQLMAGKKVFISGNIQGITKE